MSRHVEMLDGGVWSSRDPMLLKPGQLSAGRNFVYLGGSPAIYRSWGRGVFGTVSANAVDVNGLRDAQFDAGDHVLVALASASYLTAIVSSTNTFGVLVTGLPGIATQLDAAQYRNRFYLMNGLTAASGSVAQLSTSGRPCTNRWSWSSHVDHRERGPYVGWMGRARNGTGLAGSDTYSSNFSSPVCGAAKATFGPARR
jgi:hypothetical protein